MKSNYKNNTKKMIKYKNKRGYKKKRTSRRNKDGGEALASGGFGCIFKPALKCKGSSERTDGVSKMSVEQHGKQEMDEITKIRNRLKTIKGYDKYYLLDVNMCKPDKLSKDDLKKFNDKCYALTRYNINEKNINNRLGGLTILNMPNAGIDLKDWLVVDGVITREKMFLLNKIIIKLLKNGVRPMNEKGVIHNDLKDRNIMVDENDNARVIDWGLAGVVNNNKVPTEIMNRPLQFNTPFSSMIISEEFKLNYDVFLQRVKDGIILFNKMNVRNYIINEYLIKLARYYGYYDDNVILFNMIFSPGISEETFLSEVKRENLIEYGYYLYYLSNYITEILMKYTTDNMTFNLDKYFMEAYLFNSDVFGIMTVYYNFFEVKLENINLNDELKKIYLNRIRSLLIENTYSNGGEKIDIKKLINDIEELSKLLNHHTKVYKHSPSSVVNTDMLSKRKSKSKSKSKSKMNKSQKSKSTNVEADMNKIITNRTIV